MAETVVAPVNGQTLANQYDIHDPVFEYSVLEPKPTSPPATAVTGSAPQSPPSSAPAQPVGLGTPANPSPASSAPSPQKHPTWLLQDATDLGLHPLLIERLDTPELTQYVVSEMKRIRQNSPTPPVASPVLAAAATGQSQVPQSQQAPPETSATPAWDWGIHDDTDDSGRPVKKQFTDTDIHPAVGTHIKKLAQRIEQLEATIAGFHQNVTASRDSQIQSQFDAAFNKIGGVFGIGTGKQLKGTEEFNRRATIFSAVRGMMQTIPEAAREGMTIEQAVFTMARAMFGVDTGGLAAAATASNGIPTPQQFVTGGVQPPTQRRGSDQAHGREKAIEEAQNWWKENNASGAIPANGGTSLEEFLPIG